MLADAQALRRFIPALGFHPYQLAWISPIHRMRVFVKGTPKPCWRVPTSKNDISSPGHGWLKGNMTTPTKTKHKQVKKRKTGPSAWREKKRKIPFLPRFRASGRLRCHDEVPMGVPQLPQQRGQDPEHVLGPVRLTSRLAAWPARGT